MATKGEVLEKAAASSPRPESLSPLQYGEERVHDI